jgi:LPS-assembly lipoprotein
MNKRLFHLLPLLAMLWLAGCGFQPRGALPTVTGLPEPLYISGIERYSPLHRELSAQLRQAGVNLTEDGQQAGSLLRIRDFRNRSRLMGLDASNRGNEYELEQSLHFTLRSPKGGDLVGEQTVRALRILYRPANTVLAGDRERSRLREEMRRELVGKIIRRIQAQG